MFSIQPASWLAVLFNLVEFQQTRPANASVLLWLLSFLRCAPPMQLCRTLFSSSERLDAEYTTLRLRLRLLPNWHSNPQPTVSSASATLLPYRLDAEYTTLRLRLRLLPNWHSNPQPTVSSASATLLPYSAWTLLYRKEPFLGNLKKIWIQEPNFVTRFWMQSHVDLGKLPNFIRRRRKSPKHIQTHPVSCYCPAAWQLQTDSLHHSLAPQLPEMS